MMNKNRTMNELNIRMNRWKHEQTIRRLNKRLNKLIKSWRDDRTKEQTLKIEQIIRKSHDRMNKWNNEQTNEQKNKQMKD